MRSRNPSANFPTGVGLGRNQVPKPGVLLYNERGPQMRDSVK
jgi:hypothetical protein